MDMKNLKIWYKTLSTLRTIAFKTECDDDGYMSHDKYMDDSMTFLFNRVLETIKDEQDRI